MAVQTLPWILCLAVLTLPINSLKWNIFGSERNDCQMTYMWRRMNYMGVGFKHNFSEYSLFLYGEGVYAYHFQTHGIVSGIPVVFVPGNAGSGRQSRSIGSVLQNKTESRYTNFHFNVFAVDFNEQFSALNSFYLRNQADFLEAAIEHIWNMYSTPPKGLILIGHSMGGIIIREVLARPSFDLKRVAFVLTLASPHLHPPLVVDKKMTDLWQSVESSWNQSRITESHIRVISVCSGFKDELIWEELGRSQSPVVHYFSTTELDRVWLEADHLAIVWCNQLTRHASRALFYYGQHSVTSKEPFDADRMIDIFYRGPGTELRPLKRTNISINSMDCSHGCRSLGPVSLVKEPAQVVTAIGTVSSFELVSTDSKQDCHIRTRYLNDNSFFAIAGPYSCIDSVLSVNTNKSTLWAQSENQVFLAPVALRLLNVTKVTIPPFSGLRVLPIDFHATYSWAVFKVLVNRSCSNGHFRTYYSVGNVRRFDEALERDALKENRRIRIYSPNKTRGNIYLLADTPCLVQLTVEVDFVFSTKVALMEWLPSLPMYLTLTTLLLVVVCKYFYVHGIVKHYSVSFMSYCIYNWPWPIYSFLLAVALPILFLSYYFGNRLHLRSNKRISLRIDWACCFVGTATALLFHPFIGAVVVAALALWQRRPRHWLVLPLKINFLIVLLLPGVMFLLDAVKLRRVFPRPLDLFTLSTVFFAFTNTLGFRYPAMTRLLMVVIATGFLFVESGPAKYDFYLYSMESQSVISSLVYALIASTT